MAAEAERLDESILTARQREVYRAIYDRAWKEGYQPSVREIRDLLAIRSINGVHNHLNALSKKGFISMRQKIGRARCVRILRNPDGSAFTGFRPPEGVVA